MKFYCRCHGIQFRRQRTPSLQSFQCFGSKILEKECYASLYVSSGEPTPAADVCHSATKMRRNYGDSVAHHTRTYQHPQLAHKQGNAPQNQSRTSRSMEEGADGVLRGARVQDARLTGCRSHRFRAVGSVQPKRYLLEMTEEGRAEQEGRVESPQPSVVHVGVSKLGEPRSCCRGRLRPRASAGGPHRPWSKCKR